MPIEIPNYELLHSVGVGGFGEVWLARERVTAVLRAIKVISREKPELADHEIEGVKRYQHCSHQHAGLIQILTVGRVDGAYFYVMELADGVSVSPDEPYQPETLRSVMRRRGRFSARESLEIAGQLARAVNRLHEEGLTHNDIKPENILIIKGEPKIADMGLAAGKDVRTFAGTMAYMRPEGRPDDLFALGKTLYELISGLAAEEYPRLPVELAQAPTRDLTAAIKIMNRACSSEWAKGYQSASELCEAIDAASRPRTGLVDRWHHLSARRKAFALFVVTITLAGAVLGLMYLKTMNIPRLIAVEQVKGMPTFVEPGPDPLHAPYSCVYIGETRLPQSGRWKYSLHDPVINYAIDARIRCIRPWGVMSFELSPTDGDEPRIKAHVAGQPDGMGVRIDLSALPGDVEAPNPIRGHPQPGVEYWIRVVRCRDGPRLLLKPLCAASSDSMVLSLPLRCEIGLVKTLIIGSSAGRDPLARFDLLDLSVRSFSLPLADPADSAPEYANQILPPSDAPQSSPILDWPQGDLLTNEWHPLTASLVHGVPLWTSIGNWYWFAFDQESGNCHIECAPFAYLERRTVSDLSLLEGRQLLRFDGAQYSDFQARLRIRIEDPPDLERRRPYVVPGHGGSVGLAFRLQDRPPPGAERGGGYFAVITIQAGQRMALASLSCLAGLARCGANVVKLEGSGGDRTLATLNTVSQTEDLLRNDGFDLSVIARGSHLSVRLNDRSILECTDNQFSKGRIALYASRLIASFDKLEVVPLQGNTADTKRQGSTESP